jgi:methionyl-tRNA formyltransferase
VTPTARVVLFSEVNSKLGAPFLSILAAHPLITLAAVVTSPAGRLCPYFLGEEDQVDLAAGAQAAGVPLLRPANVNAPEFVRAVADLRPDYLVVGNYQQIFKAPLLAVPAVLGVNFHPSPLPRYAGWAPFVWMARNGERRSGVTAIAMTTQIDGGPVLATRPIRLSGHETALELRESHTIANVALLRELLPRLVAREVPAVPQDPSERTYFGKPGDDVLELDFGEEVETLLRTVRAGYRRPGAFAVTPEGRRLVVLTAAADDPPRLAPAAPGTVHLDARAVRVACRDGWLRLWSVEVDGQEQLARDVPMPAEFRVTVSGRAGH